MKKKPLKAASASIAYRKVEHLLKTYVVNIMKWNKERYKQLPRIEQDDRMFKSS